MDLEHLDTEAAADKGATLVLRHPVTDEDLLTEEGKPMTIDVLGAESAEARRAMAAIMKRSAGKNLSLEERDRQAVDFLVKITTGWNLVWSGEPFPFSAENARKLYNERRWIRAQVDRFAGDVGNFMAGA